MKTVNRPRQQSKTTKKTNPEKQGNLSYSVEFFHIYTDEIINNRHHMGLEYLREAEKVWDFKYERIVLIDNYNPTEHTTTASDILRYLEEQDMSPAHWAYEGDFVKNAQTLLEAVNDRKLRESYVRYIDKHGKYPCSLLTASWYVTRLGYIDAESVIRTTKKDDSPYAPARRLLNLLPRDYREVEDRAHQLVLKSKFTEAADKIQDLFYPVDAGRTVDLF